MTGTSKKSFGDNTPGRKPSKFSFTDREKDIVIGSKATGNERRSKSDALIELERMGNAFWRYHRIADNAPSNSKLKTTLKYCAKQLRATGSLLKSLDEYSRSLLTQRQVRLPDNLLEVAKTVEDVADLIVTPGGRSRSKYLEVEEFLSLAAEHLLLAGIKCGTDDTTFFGRLTALVCDKLELSIDSVDGPDRRHLARKAVGIARKNASNGCPSDHLLRIRKLIKRCQLSTGDNPS
jgi:hypothetical protein